MCFYKLTRSPVFIIGIDNGHVYTFSGIAKNAFLSDCQEIVARNKVKSGFIYGIKNPSCTIIVCSMELNKKIQQQIRNVWGFY